MWTVTNRTPFAHHGGFQRDHTGASFWCVWVKATFAVRHDRPALFVRDQRPVRLAPLFLGDDPAKDLIEDSDICPPKPMVDLVVAARAIPPRGAAGPYAAGLQCGPVTRVFHVAPLEGPQGAVPAPAELAWGQTYGGAGHAENPVGIGRGKGDPAPRVTLGGQGGPAGMNPIPKHWTRRARLGGTYDAAWEKRRAPVLPADLNPAYWQSVDPAQCLPRPLPAGLTISLQHLTSADGRFGDPLFRFALPQIALEVDVGFRGQDVPCQPVLQTIFLDTAALRLSLCWMAALPLGAAQNDVLIGDSEVRLADHAGFRALPGDAALFADAVPTPALIEG